MGNVFTVIAAIIVAQAINPTPWYGWLIYVAIVLLAASRDGMQLAKDAAGKIRKSRDDADE